jgi:hypothetical protein
MKEGAVTKQVKALEESQAKEEGIKDFFQVRDKRKRKTGGLVNDVSETLGNEAEEKEKLYKESLKEKMLPDHIVPMFNTLFLTARRNKVKTDSGLYLPTASFGGEGATDLELDFSDTQKVLAIGPQVQQAMPGMEIKLNMENFKRKLESSMAQKVNKEFEFSLPLEVIEGIEYIRIAERDISYISNSMGIKKEE